METSATLRTIATALIALAALILATFLVTPTAERISAQDGGTTNTPTTDPDDSSTAPATTGELVVVPSEVQKGQTTLAVGFHVVPFDLEVTIQYSGHFTPEDESCDNAGTAGAAPAAAAPTWITLNACTVGEGYVRMVESATGNVIKEVSVTVIQPGVTGQQARTTVTISGLASTELEPRGSGDRFSVNVAGLEGHKEYNLHTVVLNSLSAAFNRGCTSFKVSDSIVGLTSTTESHTVYGCVAPGNRLWSYVEEVGGTTIASSGITANPVNVKDPTVSFNSSSYTVNEDSTIQVTVNLSHRSSHAIRVPIMVSPGTDQSVTFANHSVSKTFTYTPEVEPNCEDETVNLKFGTLPSTVSTGGSPDEATITIKHNDVCASFGSRSYSVDEGESVTVAVKLTRAAGRSLSIPVRVSPGPDETVTFSRTGTNGTFSYTARPDLDCEDETVNLSFGTLPSAVAGTVSPSSATITIRDDDVCASFGSSSYTVGEGSSVTVSVRLSEAPGRTVRIPVRLSNGAVETLTFGSRSTSQTFPYPTGPDPNCVDETVEISFGTLPSGLLKGARDEAEITVRDDDVCVSFGSESYSVEEGDSVDIEVELDEAPGRPVDIPVIASLGRGGTVSFGRNSATGTFRYTAPEDLDSNDETAVLSFGTLPSGIVTGTPASTMVTIDDPGAITATFALSSYTVSEGLARAVIVRLDRASSQRLEIPVTVTSGRAEGGDYVVRGLTDGKLIFSAGDTSESLTIAAQQDRDNDDETVDIGFGTLPSGVVGGTPSGATVIVMDDEDVTATFDRSSYAVTEETVGIVKVSLDGESSHRVLIPIRGSTVSTPRAATTTCSV